jgi:hypothetical protein
MFYIEQYRRAKKDSGQSGMTSVTSRNLLRVNSFF